MKKMLVTIALGVSAISAPALAQAPGGGDRGGFMQRDFTRDQAKQMADMMFQQLDANHDGTLTRAEADQGAAQFSSPRGGGRIQRMIAQAFGDAQSVTLQQFEAKALARFDAQDLNHDGTVTAAERQQAREQRAQAQPTAPGEQDAPAKPQ
nr:EF-hand domain-containing protein [Sphingomonas sp.]